MTQPKLSHDAAPAVLVPERFRMNPCVAPSVDALAGAPLFSRQDGLAVQEPERSWEFAPSVESFSPDRAERLALLQNRVLKSVIQCPVGLQMELALWRGAGTMPGASQMYDAGNS
jgi:hypothetical protein